jgi:muramidase (phage lysozyme)
MELFIAAFDLDDNGEIITKNKHKEKKINEMFHKHFVESMSDIINEYVYTGNSQTYRKPNTDLDPMMFAPAPNQNQSPNLVRPGGVMPGTNYTVGNAPETATAKVMSEPVYSVETPEVQALLNTISSGEASNYHTLYGNNPFPMDSSGNPDYTQFPRWKGQDNSHAAGRYQFEPKTWAYYANKLDLPDFSPASQDKAAVADAQDRYSRATNGGDLVADLQSGKNINRIGGILHPEWTSVNARNFESQYNRNLEMANNPQPQQTVVATNQRPNVNPSTTQPIPNTQIATNIPNAPIPQPPISPPPPQVQNQPTMVAPSANPVPPTPPNNPLTANNDASDILSSPEMTSLGTKSSTSTS